MKKIVCAILMLSNLSYASSLGQFSLRSDKLGPMGRFEILASNGDRGIIRNTTSSDFGDLHCYGTFRIKDGWMKLNYHYGRQDSHPGYCGNNSADLIVGQRKLWKMEVGEEKVITFMGIRTYGFERGVTLRREK